MYETKDSGQRETFTTGSVRDTRAGKGRFDLISPVGLRRLAAVMERGAIKYGERNWQLGQPMSRVIDSAIRHLNQYLAGDRSEDHLAQSAFNVFALMHFEELQPEMDDLPRYPGHERSAIGSATQAQTGHDFANIGQERLNESEAAFINEHAYQGPQTSRA